MKWVFTGLLLFVTLLIGAIAINGSNWNQEKTEFKEKCEAQGGKMYVPRGIKTWPEIVCFDKDVFITVE